ncbi:MAG TPA: polyprenyl synthetase family protein [Lacipirellulaceae bacterium]|nr:polyprenyl synthetase family protein [Lacipirellulaceae bacterium]
MAVAATFEEPLFASPRRALIDAALREAAEFGRGCPAELAEAIRYALLAPGKRLRPHLVLLAAEACEGSVDAALPAAVAVEMVHAYSLVHDDLPAMDNDDLRRGRPTCHRQFDEATAILAGDALLARAFEVLASGIQPADRAAACCAELARAAGPEALVGGQADDLAAEFRRVGLERLEAIHRRKTAALFRASLTLGAISAGADHAQRDALLEYGEALGLAFQIVDDLLDVSGQEQAVGKRLGKDRSRGKVTYPALLGVAESRRRADALVARAVAALELFGERGRPLRELAESMGRRTS